jgi:hypothetical protein
VVTGYWGEFNAVLGHGLLEIDGFDNTATGQQQITVSFGARFTSFSVTVNKLNLVSISIQTQPAKTAYLLGDDLDLSGIAVRIGLNTGVFITVNAGDSGLSTSGFDTTQQGTKPLLLRLVIRLMLSIHELLTLMLQ